MQFSEFSARRFLTCSVMILIFCFVLPLATLPVASESTASSLSITAMSDRSSYYLRETVNVTGNFSEDGSPASWGLVSLEVRRPLPTVPQGEVVLFRTVTVGIPAETWRANITGAQLKDNSGNPTDKALVKTQVQVSASIRNLMSTSISGYVTVSMCDGNLIPIFAAYSPLFLSSASQTTVTFGPVPIPEWAYCGKGLIFVNFFDALPMNDGTAYTPERAVEYYVTRNLEVGPPYRPPQTSCSSSPGKYSIAFQVSPDKDEIPETYPVYVTARKGYTLRTSSTTQFTVQDEPTPPQAAFTYSPLKIYRNMSVRFDASSSSAEGYGDNITKYKWMFNDPYNPQQNETTNPVVYHTFPQNGTFVVELNVTDNEGLWSTTSKPVKVLPEFGPTANFTWDPQQIFQNMTVTFNASSSQMGWSAIAQKFSPIINYTWNFQDGTPNVTLGTPVTTHNFTQIGNYSVTLTIKDDVSRTSTISYIVQVQNRTFPPWDVNQDGKVRVDDVLIVAQHFGMNQGDPNWDPRADINGDNKVRVDDILLVAQHFGETY